MTIRPLVELLAVKKKKESKASINEEIHTQVSRFCLLFSHSFIDGNTQILSLYRINQWSPTFFRPWTGKCQTPTTLYKAEVDVPFFLN